MTPYTPEEWLSEPRYVCGIMTGTSVDAVDIAIAKFFIGANGKHKFELVYTDAYSFSREIIAMIFNIIEKQVEVRDVAVLHYALAHLFADRIKLFCYEHDFPLMNIDAVGIHGQTVWHEPSGVAIGKFQVASTLQLCSIPALAQLLNLPVVGDFRSADIALGGQGAPLVPIFDYEFIRSTQKDRIALNIGGIANITYLPKACKKNQVIAFDTGPGNVWIDASSCILFDDIYDEDGEYAASGNLIHSLFEKMKAIPYISQMPPKSTGRELFSTRKLLELLEGVGYTKLRREDVIRTITEFTAWSIALNIRQFARAGAEIVVSGGGAENVFLIKLIENYLPESRIIKSDELNIPSDYKEALSFAYLAYRTIGHLPGNIPSVTGASKKAVLGAISFP